MIRGPDVVISYNPLEFPDEVDSGRKYPPSTNTPEFITRYQGELAMKGDFILSGSYAYKMRTTDTVPRAKRVTNTMIKITYEFKFIKRKDLLPHFKTVVENGYESIIVDGQYFHCFKDAFFTMFTVNGDTVVAKEWQPYSIVIRNLEHVRKTNQVIANMLPRLRGMDDEVREFSNLLSNLKFEVMKISNRLDIETTRLSEQFAIIQGNDKPRSQPELQSIIQKIDFINNRINRIDDRSIFTSEDLDGFTGLAFMWQEENEQKYDIVCANFSKLKRLCSGIHNKLIVTERSIGRRVARIDDKQHSHDVMLQDHDDRIVSLESSLNDVESSSRLNNIENTAAQHNETLGKYENAIGALSSRLTRAEENANVIKAAYDREARFYLFISMVAIIISLFVIM